MNSPAPRVLQWINSIDPNHGGPSRSVPALSEALRTVGVISDISVWESSGKRGQVDGEVSLIHDHGVWLRSNHAAAAAARARGLPLVVSPRGMLEPWALNHHRWKKKLAWSLYQRSDLRRAAVIHVTSAEEADSVRELGIDRPIAIVPNGVETPPEDVQSASSDIRRALFLSRLHPKKGLPNLLQAWAQVAPKGWELAIAGTGTDEETRVVAKSIDRLGLKKSVHLLGPIQDSRKWDLYQSASLFVLPTHSENFGLVVAEALSCGVPVITTRGAPWRGLEEERCGWWVDIGAAPLATALTDAIALSDAERAEMGDRGRRLVADRYSWPRIAEEMRAVYEWVAGSGRRPGSVCLPA